MQPRVLIIQTFYPEFLAAIYAEEPTLAALDFEKQLETLFASAFSTSDSYSRGLRQLGCDAVELICNADAAQLRWALEHGVAPSDNIHDQRRQIIAAQVDYFRPDVVYVFEWCCLGDSFLKDLQGRVRLLVGEISSSLSPHRSFAAYDLMVSSFPPIVDYFRSLGVAAEFMRLGCDDRVLDCLGPGPPCYDVTFIGGFAPPHADRVPWLEALLKEVDVDIFGYGIQNTPPRSPIRAHFRGEAWGRKMFDTLRRSRITLNLHGRIEVPGLVNAEWPNNMRLYEATGVGACLVTDWRPQLGQLFEPDREVVAYRDVDECIAKIRYYLDHEAERAAVAEAGQQRTLREHLFGHRMQELLEIFRRCLQNERA